MINFNEKEIWAVIKDFPRYQVSNFGKIQNIKTQKILKPGHTKNGYCAVELTNNNGGKSVYVHRLVAQAFVVNVDNKPEVNHKDENKDNNSAWNLEWVTHAENIRYSKAKPVRCIETGEEFKSGSDASRYLGLSSGAVGSSIRCKRPIKGLHWEYI